MKKWNLQNPSEMSYHCIKIYPKIFGKNPPKKPGYDGPSRSGNQPGLDMAWTVVRYIAMENPPFSWYDFLWPCLVYRSVFHWFKNFRKKSGRFSYISVSVTECV